ncbi:FG-GAP-like repeat-containing protein [Streptomyces albus]
MRRRRVWTVVTALALGGAALGLWSCATGSPPQGGVSVAAATAGSGEAADIDGDGHDDLAVGAPGATVRGKSGAGQVALAFGSEKGVVAARHQVLSRADPRIPGSPQAGGAFGSALAMGDLDGDGHADLVVGASGENAGGTAHAGSVTVVFGARDGLSDAALTFHAPSPTERGGFGGQLTLGDFDHDGLKDIAVADGKQIALVLGAKNLRDTNGPKITLHVPPGGGAALERLASGDIDGDGHDDLVTIASSDDPADEGALAVLPGTDSGVGGEPLGHQVSLPSADFALAVGDIDADGKDDVVIDTGFGDAPDDTVLRTYPGGASGLRVDDPVVWKGERVRSDTVRLADLDGDGHADLIVGDRRAPSAEGHNDAGALRVAPGSKRWFDSSAMRTVSLDTRGVPGGAAGNDRFASALAVGDYDGDGTADVAVGVPGRSLKSGAVCVLLGGPDGVSGRRAALFNPEAFGADPDAASFGAALAG